MVQQVTRGIKISVNTCFKGTLYRNQKLFFAFEYHITIENQSNDFIQLNTRYWNILDALNDREIVFGNGVIGKTPKLAPGECHTYTSNCMITSPFGAMNGHYTMFNFSTATTFKVQIPTFKLCANFALN